jgi:transposase
MGFTFTQKSGNYEYIYEAVSYRNENGEPRNSRVPIGKINPKTGRPVYKPEYIERMRAAGAPVEIDPQDLRYSVEEIRQSTIRDCGATYLLEKIAERDGLLQVIREALPQYWREIFTLASFLATTGEPAVYCEEWTMNAETLPVGSMSSQRISELLLSIEPVDRDMFFSSWCDFRSDREYLALDITSTSSYSELIDDVEWGYNRDKEKLPQVNICMLMGEQSMLPIYQTVFSGSLKDVSTLTATLAGFDSVTNGKPVLAVMDKGFFSKRNTDAMLAMEGMRFIASVPFTSAFAKKQVESERKDIDTADKTIVIGGDSMRAVTKTRSWDKEHEVYAHVCFNAKKAAGIREALYADAAILKEEAISDPEKCAASDEHRKYLNIRKTAKGDSCYTVSIKEDAIANELKTSGWMVAISNDVSDARTAMRIYRSKDVVEKGFMRFKNSLDMGRLRVHDRERMQNKLFVGFIALILLSEIHKVMSEKRLYRSMTMRQLMRTLSKLRVQEISGNRILFPLTKAQREIFEAFDIEPPM